MSIKSLDIDPSPWDFQGDVDLIVNRRNGNQWVLLRNGRLLKVNDADSDSFTPSGTGVPTTVSAFLNDPYFYSSAICNGEVFYTESGETVFVLSADQTESSSTGTGTNYTPGSTYSAVKFVAAHSKYIQGISLRVKKNGALTDTSYLDIALYSDSGGAPNTLLASGGRIYGGQTTTSYQELSTILQIVGGGLTASTTYWVVITRSESGGNFVLDSTTGSGQLYEGAALGALADTSKALYYKIYNRSEYPIHTVGNYTHGGWFVSLTGVGVRGDSTGHYGLYGQSTSAYGVRGFSTYTDGGYFSSTNGNGLTGSTPAASAYGVYGENTHASGGFPGVYGNSTSGAGILANTAMGGDRPYSIRAFQGLMFGSTARIMNEAAAVPSSGQYYNSDVLFNTALTARGGAAFWYCTATGVPGNWAPVNVAGVGADVGNSATTLTVGASDATQIYATAITADRAVALSTTGAYNGAKFRIVRKASCTGAFNVNVGTGPLKAMGTPGSFCDVEYDGSAWILTAYGAL